MAPAPRSRVPRGEVVDTTRKQSEQLQEGVSEVQEASTPRKLSLPESGNGPRAAFLMRRRSSGHKGSMEPLRSDDPEVYQHLRHLGPSNAANRPKSTRINTVKIKPGTVPAIPQTIPENARPSSSPPPPGVVTQQPAASEGGVGEGLLASAGRDASDGVHSVAVGNVGYGTMAPNGDRTSWQSRHLGYRGADDDILSPKATGNENDERAHLLGDNTQDHNDSKPRSRSVSTIGSLRSARSHSPPTKRHTARSGSISENIVDVNGIKKIVLETTSSSDSEDKGLLSASQTDGAHDSQAPSETESANPDGKAGGGRKKRKKRGKKKKGNAGDSHES
jgi:metal transporter CNNM